MKRIKTILFIAVIVLLQMFGCTKKADTVDPISGSTTGTKTFWSSQAGQNITVKVNGSNVGSISSYYSSSTPDCSASGNVNFAMSSGVVYSYTATDGTHNWSGSFTGATGCNTLKLFW